MEKRFQNKVALITGGSRGIGAAIARRFAKEGAHVAISFTASKDQALSLVKELEKEGVQALALQADQAHPAQVKALVEKVGKHFGHIDILVNNAGVYVDGAIDDPHLDIEALARQHAINVGGCVLRDASSCCFHENRGPHYYHRFHQWRAHHTSRRG